MEVETPIQRQGTPSHANVALPKTFKQPLALVDSRHKKHLFRSLRHLREDLLRNNAILIAPSTWIIRQWVDFYFYSDAKYFTAPIPGDYSTNLLHCLKRLKYFCSNAASDDPAHFPTAHEHPLELSLSFLNEALEHFERIKVSPL